MRLLLDLTYSVVNFNTRFEKTRANNSNENESVTCRGFTLSEVACDSSMSEPAKACVVVAVATDERLVCTR